FKCDWSSDVCSSDLALPRTGLSGLPAPSLTMSCSGGSFLPIVQAHLHRMPEDAIVVIERAALDGLGGLRIRGKHCDRCRVAAVRSEARRVGKQRGAG